jgi:acetyl-CoA carboxylase biotin carboxyl carrier protein
VNVDLSQIRELLTILNQTDITELTIEANDFRLSIRKEKGQAVFVPPPPVAAPAAAPAARTLQPATPPPPERNLIDIVAPMVGTFYRAPAPDAANFVEIGSEVRKGQTVCIIEAMKLMNAIECEVDGRIAEILVQNGEPIEYNQPLMRIEPL